MVRDPDGSIDVRHLRVFPDEPGREAHLAGPIAAALTQNADDLLTEPPKIEKVDVLASKLSE